MRGKERGKRYTAVVNTRTMSSRLFSAVIEVMLQKLSMWGRGQPRIIEDNTEKGGPG